MGNYNPHQPYILGEEWVPIRDAALVYSPLVSTVERGTAFTLASAQRPRDARFYVNQMTAELAFYHVGQVNIYPYGQEDQTGPIRQVVVPVSAVNVTGTGISFLSGSYLEAISYPGDNNYIYMQYNLGSPQRFGFFFDALSSYPELANKRILNVSLVYSAAAQDTAGGLPVDYAQPVGSSLTVVSQTNDLGQEQQFPGKTFGNGVGSLSDMNTTVVNGSSLNGTTIETLNLGDINNAWNTADIGGTEKLPWRYVDMLRLTSTYGTGRQFIKLSVNLPAAQPNALFYLQYIALRVIYCEEKRAAYGGQQFQYVPGMNKVTLRDLNQAADPVLAAGQYLPTLTFVNPGQVGFGTGLTADFPILNALTELYQIPTHPAVELAVPFPLAERIGEVFTSTSSHLLPQLSLHASGGTLTEPHVYGRQAAAQVYGANTATQDIYDDISGVANTYPQVRYYARRFGDTTIPLTLTGVGTLSGSAVSITVADFDALAEILDGWKEVTLRFATAPSMGTVAGNPAWTWSAVSETSGNRWEILAASAPAVSGTPGNSYNPVPAPNALGVATYQPPAGDTVELTWMPQGIASGWVTGSTIDASTDAVLIFSQDPAIVSGLSLSQLTQSVSGIGGLCGGVPCCIPTGIGYNQLSWTAPVTQSAIVVDTFTRSTPVTGSWGVATSGQPWTGAGPTVSQISANGTRGLMAINNNELFSILSSVTFADIDETITGSQSNGATQYGEMWLYRWIDANNWVRGGFFQAGGVVNAFVQTNVAGARTTLSTTVTAIAVSNNDLKLRLQIVGTTVKFKVWLASIAEPDAWTITTTNTTGPATGVPAVSSVSTTTATFSYDDFSAFDPTLGTFGAFELQRWDPYTSTGDFETIMLATSPLAASFRDYEARVGVTSVYRMRTLNVLNFAGLWSTYVSGAPPAPGVTGGCGSQDGVLIFTSNSSQTGADSAAYVMQWDGTPNEAFDLPEADMVTFQPMYGRDGSIAFHGTERGLEEFSRQVLLQAGAIALPSLADATDIRDLAWAQFPYVCVRDDRGNRWFANVRVSGVNARNNARNYTSSVAVTEQTRIPYPVDP